LVGLASAAIQRTFGRIAAIYYFAPKTCRSQCQAAASKTSSCGYTGHAASLFHAAHEFLGMFEKRFFQVKSALQTVGLITWQIVGLVTL
jgi:hypothetical protein